MNATRLMQLLAAVLLWQSVALASVPAVIHFQGRLCHSDGTPVTGSASITMHIYDASATGTLLWSESHAIACDEGYYTVLLGSDTLFPAGIFDSPTWLEVAVDGETAGSRFRLASVPYAIVASDSVTVGGVSVNTTPTAGDLLPLDGTGKFPLSTMPAGIDAVTLDGNAPSAFAPTSHDHDGSNIASGTVAEPRLDASIARDAEILPAVLAGDGSGSGLNADLLDDLDSADFAPVAHSHDAVDIATGNVHSDRFSAYDDLVAEGTIGTGADQVAAGDHTHAGTIVTRYLSLHHSAFTTSANNGIQRNATRLAMATVGGFNFYAPVNIPDGSEIRSMTATVKDANTLGQVSVALSGPGTIGSASTGGPEAPGVTTLPIPLSAHTVDNQANAYFVTVSWSSSSGFEFDYDLRKVTIEYETTAP